ncbi:MAG: EAL domain-containing protein [Sulfurimonas sp.]
MNEILNKKVLNLIPIVFLIIILLKIIYSYNHLKEDKYNFAKKEAEVLNDYALIHRNYYQHLFVNKTIPLNSKTLKVLPAYSNSIISKHFSKVNSLHITVRTVSDRARNPLNNADNDELEAINYFKKNQKSIDYFSEINDLYYQYASVLRINDTCLKCHGAKEDAPTFIRNRYSAAYNYKLGEVRGILSIKVPKDSVGNYFLRSFIESVVYDIILFILLFLGISFLAKKSKNINKNLQKEIQEKTKALKSTFVIDKLTTLPNRKQLLEDIAFRKNKKTRYIALLNIDAFKDINDFYGHAAGDKVLKDLAVTIVQECLCEEVNIYKLPSDEFAILSTKVTSQKVFSENISRLIDIIQKKVFIIQNNKIFIFVNCGISCNEKDLMTTADVALNIAKKEQINLVVYEDKFDISHKIVENTQSISLLRNAIENDEITPFYQPIYNLKTKKIEKYECLIRIVQNDGTIILPFKFLDVAVKSKQYLQLTKIMVNKAFKFFEDKEYEFSINLSIVDIQSHDMQEFILQKLENFEKPQLVVFEILENDKLGNYKDVKEFITKIKKFGCKFAIDDFGSGYSNFSHVYELNVDYLKIDASLVKYVSTDENSRIIVKTIVNFASSLGLKTIAEYVEDIESLEILEKMGVDYIQGYYIGKPDKDIQK